MITVMGAKGNTGRKIAHGLLASGHEVRALGRSASALADLERAGAEVRIGDAADAAFLIDAFRGAKAVYTLLPTDQAAPDYYGRQQEEGEAIAQAIRASGVRHVVALSCLGAETGESNGVIAGLHAQEERLKRLQGVNLFFLRPVSFFENFVGALPVIEALGVNADSVLPDLEIPMVATKDIAAVAVQALADRDWSGVVVRELLGPRDLSYREATRILGAAINRPDLEYVQLPYDEMVAAMVQGGVSASFARQYVEMTRAFNEGRVQPSDGRTAANTTPTRFEDFVVELVADARAA